MNTTLSLTIPKKITINVVIKLTETILMKTYDLVREILFNVAAQSQGLGGFR